MGLSGDLADLPLSDLIEMMSVGGKSGRLVLYDGEEAVAGVLRFRGGRLVGAHSGLLRAERAFYALLSLKSGSFDFDPQAALGEDEVDLSSEFLLLEGMRRLDETSRLRRRLSSHMVAHYVGGEAESCMEERVLVRLLQSPAAIGDLVEVLLTGGDIDEYDVLHALHGLASRRVVRLERGTSPHTRPVGPESPQPELEP